MTKEEKQLLIKDLCARVPYVTFVYVDWHETEELEICEGCEDDEEEPNIHTLISCNYYGECDLDDNLSKTIYDIKPYLRPMSSMTEEEKDELCKLCDFEKSYDDEDYFTHYCVEIISEYCVNGKKIPESFINYRVIDFFHEHQLDWRGLIPMGLALEAKEGMYKIN